MLLSARGRRGWAGGGGSYAAYRSFCVVPLSDDRDVAREELRRGERGSAGGLDSSARRKSGS